MSIRGQYPNAPRSAERDPRNRPARLSPAGRRLASAFAERWAERRSLDAVAEARHSDVIRRLRLVLPLVALVIVAIVLVYSSVTGERSGLTLSYDETESQADDLKMIRPKLTGVDGAQRPFTVTAEYALQEKGRPDRVRLVKIEGDVTMEGGSWLAIAAAEGQLDGKTQILELTGGIDAYSDLGYEMHTQTMTIDFGKGTITGNEPVRGQGPLGVIKADRFEVERALSQVRFLGNVETVYVPQPVDGIPVPASSAPKPAAPAPATMEEALTSAASGAAVPAMEPVGDNATANLIPVPRGKPGAPDAAPPAPETLAPLAAAPIPAPKAKPRNLGTAP